MDKQKITQYVFSFDDNMSMNAICGVNNEHLAVLEELFENPIYMKGNQLILISSSTSKFDGFRQFCNLLLDAYTHKVEITVPYIKSAYFQLTGNNTNSAQDKISSSMDAPSRKKSSDIACIRIPISDTQVIPKTEGQRDIIESLEQKLLTFLVGPAGTGKTYFATAFALKKILSKEVERYIITRPVVEAGEKLGYLPGDLVQKIFPYLRPIYDALYELVGEMLVSILQEKNQLEIAPLAYMRGRTLKNAVVLLDEAQNCSPAQMRMFLSRLGDGSVGIVTGDLTQSDLSMNNGLTEAMEVFKNTKDIGIVELTEQDVQRSKLAKIVIHAYDTYKHRV